MQNQSPCFENEDIEEKEIYHNSKINIMARINSLLTGF
jgi:hypothetical protein